jgi:hypothetical protein
MTKIASQLDHGILLLQGGGALGGYHAGVYRGMAEAGHAPTCVVGVSIGAITAALIVGNPPERRVERLRAFWERVSSYAPLAWPAWLDPMRPAYNLLSAGIVATFGSPGFFVPRVPPAVLHGGGRERTVVSRHFRTGSDQLRGDCHFAEGKDRSVARRHEGANEAKPGWRAFPKHLMERGLDGVKASRTW